MMTKIKISLNVFKFVLPRKENMMLKKEYLFSYCPAKGEYARLKEEYHDISVQMNLGVLKVMYGSANGYNVLQSAILDFGGPSHKYDVKVLRFVPVRRKKNLMPTVSDPIIKEIANTLPTVKINPFIEGAENLCESSWRFVIGGGLIMVSYIFLLLCGIGHFLRVVGSLGDFLKKKGQDIKCPPDISECMIVREYLR